MTIAERTILQILLDEGELSLDRVDRLFVLRSPVEEFAPRILTDLVSTGLVENVNEKYAISAAGKKALERDAA